MEGSTWRRAAFSQAGVIIVDCVTLLPISCRTASPSEVFHLVVYTGLGVFMPFRLDY